VSVITSVVPNAILSGSILSEAAGLKPVSIIFRMMGTAETMPHTSFFGGEVGLEIELLINETGARLGKFRFAK
jgi:hypothetical protein